MVAVLIPREPDIGYGRPSVPSVVPPKTAEWIAKTFKVPPCAERPQCTGSLPFASDLRQAVIERLERAKADLRTNDPPNIVRRIAPN